jgi:RNA polymerase sigma-70 factor (ECF subfamily)
MNIIKNLCQQRELRQKIANNHKRLYRTAYAWGHDAELASDLAQETMAKALKRINQLRDPNKLNSWLFGILINCWRDHFRQRRDVVDIADIDLKHEDTPEKLKHKQDIVDNVRSSVARLPEGQRQVVTLVNLEGFSYAEVAEILEIPVGTVMSRLSRARSTLADYLLTYKTNQDVSSGDKASQQPRLRRIK